MLASEPKPIFFFRSPVREPLASLAVPPDVARGSAVRGRAQRLGVGRRYPADGLIGKNTGGLRLRSGGKALSIRPHGRASSLLLHLGTRRIFNGHATAHCVV